MAKLRREAHRRTLGNGYCARPVELDCHFESICESYTFFVTTLEFRPAQQRQRDDDATSNSGSRTQIVGRRGCRSDLVNRCMASVHALRAPG